MYLDSDALNDHEELVARRDAIYAELDGESATILPASTATELDYIENRLEADDFDAEITAEVDSNVD
jgi:hypothetical protein